MQAKTVVVSLPVSDLARSLSFYQEGLGLAPSDLDETIIAFELPNLSLFLIVTDEYATYIERAGVAASAAPVPGACIISCAIGTNAEVDEILERAARAGATTSRWPGDDGGRTGYFSDPDGHIWELVYNARTASANGS